MADLWHKTCLRCGGAMEEGYVLDITDSGKKTAKWIEGAPERSVWVGLKTGSRRSFALRAYRCAECGFVDLYAPGRGEE
ncbi:MAG: hypothetical protein HKN04_10685 [Rhodothermaceae bacterium]|nr:hypothetical protein [Rhodothermaceae bacterium]